MANSNPQYFQCHMRRVDPDGTSHHTTGWIEARGAKQGAVVELLPSKEKWEVIEVCDHPIPQDMLREQQRLNRNSLPSVEGIH